GSREAGRHRRPRRRLRAVRRPARTGPRHARRRRRDRRADRRARRDGGETSAPRRRPARRAAPRPHARIRLDGVQASQRRRLPGALRHRRRPHRRPRPAAPARAVPRRRRLMAPVSAARRREVVDALRRGTVPQAGLDLFAVGLGRFETAIDDELSTAVSGGAVFKAVRGEYGSGKTFFARWLAERAKRRGMAATEIQISETETPLHRLETVYRRLVERMSTASYQPSALRDVVEAWFFTLEEEVLAEGTVP